MSRIVGMDLGTTNSLVAVVESGIPMVLADAEGRRLTPSVVHYPAEGAEPWVGHAAQRVRALHPQHTVFSIKRFMARRAAEVTEAERSLPYSLQAAENGLVSVELHGRAVAPEAVSAEVLRQLKTVAERSLETEVTRAVITVPAYFNDAQRQATKRAGELAGLTVERILNEPTAAALAYGLNRLKEKSKVAVYDLGGGTFDLSILELHEGVFQVLSTHGNTRLGGDDLDERLTGFLLEQLQRTRADLSPSAPRPPAWSARLREAAEQAKIRLSTETETIVSLPFLSSDFSFEYRLTREELERLTRDILERTRAHCLRALSDAKLEPKDLDQVILVGGQTRMPLVRRLVAEWFGCAPFEETRGALHLGTGPHPATGPVLNTSVNPDEAVALGAAIQAAILSGEIQNVLLLDVTPLSLGLETFGGLMNVIIPRNSTIPVKAGELFTTAVDNQRAMLIHVLQGERERAKDNWSLGRFTLEFDPAPRGVPRVGVQFEIDANGILNVLARDTATGHQRLVELKSAVDVDDAAVQQMVEESVEHAFEDLTARRWVEARLKAQELLAATRKGLAEYETALAGEQVTKLRDAVATVESCLAGENAETGAGDVQALKAACDALDLASHPLAELMMDRAMEALLRQRGMLT